MRIIDEYSDKYFGATSEIRELEDRLDDVEYRLAQTELARASSEDTSRHKTKEIFYLHGKITELEKELKAKNESTTRS